MCVVHLNIVWTINIKKNKMAATGKLLYCHAF